MISIITKGRIKEPTILTIHQMTTTYQDSDYIQLQDPSNPIIQLDDPDVFTMILQNIEPEEVQLT